MARSSPASSAITASIVSCWSRCGHRVRLWRPDRAEEHMRPVIPPRRPRLGRATPPRLLGAGTDQCVAYHRTWLVDAIGDARLMGRRHGPYPMDARSMAQHRSRLRRRWPRVAVRLAATRWPPRALSRPARQIPPRRTLGYEVRLPSGLRASGNKTYAAWRKAGVVRADGKALPAGGATAKAWEPVDGGRPSSSSELFAVRSYNPSLNYTLAIVHLADRLAGGGPFAQAFPGSERALTLAEIQEVQKRLTAAGFDTRGPMAAPAPPP